MDSVSVAREAQFRKVNFQMKTRSSAVAKKHEKPHKVVNCHFTIGHCLCNIPVKFLIVAYFDSK